MQRIDENTYIDDSLVTGAEYQLFIDEMREQGKYYQPDHWTSYQFPQGHAQEPILGLRHSDALAFCKWLTQREIGEWFYSLPTQEQAANFLIGPLEQTPVGYWLNGVVQFAWLGPVPKDPRRIDFESVRSLARIRAHTFNPDLTRHMDRARTRAHVLDLNRARELDLDPTSAHTLDFDLTRDLGLARSRALEHDPDRDFGVKPLLTRTIELQLDRYFGIDRALSLLHNLTIDRAHYEVHSRLLELTLDIYFDLFTLRERIAGRSPAFEGIRLVKERIP
jgi:hypothetical protein